MLVFQKVEGGEKVPLLACRTRKGSTDGTWSLVVEYDDEYDDELSTLYLIEYQRKLGESPRLLDRLRAVILGDAFSDRLNGLSDRQIGQVLFDFCWPEC